MNRDMEIGVRFTIKTQRKPTYFSRGRMSGLLSSGGNKHKTNY